MLRYLLECLVCRQHCILRYLYNLGSLGCTHCFFFLPNVLINTIGCYGYTSSFMLCNTTDMALISFMHVQFCAASNKRPVFETRLTSTCINWNFKTPTCDQLRQYGSIKFRIVVHCYKLILKVIYTCIEIKHFAKASCSFGRNVYILQIHFTLTILQHQWSTQKWHPLIQYVVHHIIAGKREPL